MLVSVWVFVFMLVYKGATRPLDFVLLDYNGAITPRPFLCVHKEKGKEMHLLMRRRRLCETRKASFKGCSACRHFSKKDCACERRSPWGTLIKNVGVTWKWVEFLVLLLCWWGCGL